MEPEDQKDEGQGLLDEAKDATKDATKNAANDITKKTVKFTIKGVVAVLIQIAPIILAAALIVGVFSVVINFWTNFNGNDSVSAYAA